MHAVAAGPADNPCWMTRDLGIPFLIYHQAVNGSVANGRHEFMAGATVISNGMAGLYAGYLG